MRRARRALQHAVDSCTAHIRWALGALIALQIVLTLAVMASIQHNGWVYYQGGDQIWLVTSGWLLSDMSIPYAEVGWGWPLVLAPLTAISGPTFVELLPLTMALQVLVLAPIATLAVYDIGTRVAGRVGGLWCALLWVTAPFIALPLFVDRYQGRWAEQFLPQAFGLTQMADFPSMVIVAVAAALVIRSLDRTAIREAALAGALTGYAVGVKPANALFIAAPAVAYLAARRWRTAVVFGLALAPALLTLAVWKQRGIGGMPLFTHPGSHLAASEASSIGGIDLDRYFPLDLDSWKRNMSNLREFFWSARLVQWAPLAGAIAVARRSVPVAVFLLVWMLTYVVVKGSNVVASIESGSFWRLVMPAFAAFLLLASAIPLLVPTLHERLRARLEPQPAWRPGRRLVAGSVAALWLVPLAVVLVASPSRGSDRAVIVDGILTPVDGGTVSLQVEARGREQHLSWTDTTGKARTFYRVYRSENAEPDTDCVTAGADRCELKATLLGATRRRAFVDIAPEPGVTYRVGVGTNWLDDETQGDIFVLSPPVSAPA